MKRFMCACLLLVLSCLSAAACAPGPVETIVYHDGNRDALSGHAQSINPLLDTLLPGIGAYLLDGQSERYTVSALDGSFDFGPLDPGTFLLDLEIDATRDCTSNNRGVRLPAAVREGAVHIVSIGDSTGVAGSETPYPDRLTNRIAEMVPTTLTNLAVSGSVSSEWLPGADRGYFDHRLVPVLAEADVVTVTLGGNDLRRYLPDEPPYDPFLIFEEFLNHPEYFAEMLANVAAIIQEIRTRNPSCDVAYLIYPNLANSDRWVQTVGDAQPLASLAMKIAMVITRATMAGIQGIVLADVFGALGDTWLDGYLADEIHPNDEGHQVYADVFFRSLGGSLWVRIQRTIVGSGSMRRIFSDGVGF